MYAYGPSGHGPGLLTDLYQLTMASGYLRSGLDSLQASFYLSFRENPFGGGFALACGLEQAIGYLDSLCFGEADLAYLADLATPAGTPLFAPGFLEWLEAFEFGCDVDAVPEGTVVFAGEPLVRVTGPIAHCQLVETALLNALNFQTLVATKAARICLAAGGDPVFEFGLRRAQGPDGGVSATRAAYVGGCSGTSNVLAAARFGIPAVGTHAHSWVMAFDSEEAAFEAYATAMPDNCTLLVDTYDTLEGVHRAAEVGRRLAESGHRMFGIRIDSGDLAWLSRRAREILDAAGLADVRIVASNELDEYLIDSLKEQGAAIDIWGVGTKLVTAYDQPALGGVYKLSAIRSEGAEWSPRLKVSEQTAKVTLPGVLGVRRYYHDGVPVGDMIYDIERPPGHDAVMVDPADPIRRKAFSAEEDSTDLLRPVYRAGDLVYETPDIGSVRDHASRELAALDSSQRRFLNPHVYPVGLEQSVSDAKMRLILRSRGIDQAD